ncbi:MAG: hypothetical protein IKC54_00140 [Clostridia bacterium]|nr:hypothetical protein [Clostridia bacterium]
MALYPKLANQFYAGLWGRIQHPPTQNTVLTTYSILSKKHVEWATTIAYSTIERAIQNKVINSMLVAHLLQNNFFSNLAKDYISYFKNPAPINQAVFNNWHSGVCNQIIDVLNQCNAQKIATYGIAQKIVNMTFKHLSCFNDAHSKRDHFKYCHMALDRFTLKWFYSKVVPWYRSNPITLSTTKKNNIGGCFWKTWKSGIKTTPWSDLDEDEYTDIITLISGYFANNPPNPPVTILEAEFVIWYQAKNGYSSRGNKKYSY